MKETPNQTIGRPKAEDPAGSMNHQIPTIARAFAPTFVSIQAIGASRPISKVVHGFLARLIFPLRSESSKSTLPGNPS
jgi:hypothetical protein